MTGDRHDAAGTARRTRRQKVAAWFTAWYYRSPGTVVIGGFLLLLTAVFLLVGQFGDSTPEPCPPSKVCDFVR
ncbi:hypothetical protein GCM10023235_05780 [Kitasatospora terrestris]|uniref:Uncharacterized protein n=1 Tax=Kitasatospora terrestris TaxID=258051 RepID=A0ABP9DF19_9ACTN